MERNAADLTSLAITAGNDYVVAFPNGADHSQGQACRLGIISVHCHNDVFWASSLYRFQQAATHGFCQAFISIVMKSNDRVTRPIRIDYFASAIGAAVIHHDDGVFSPLVRKVLDQRIEKMWQRLLFVISGKDNENPHWVRIPEPQAVCRQISN